MMTPLQIPPFVSACIAITLASLITLKGPRSEVTRAFALLCFETFIWQACWFAGYFLQEPFQKDLLIRVAWLSVVYIPFTYYDFAVRFLALHRELRWVRRSYVFATVFLAIAWTSNWFIAGYRDFSWGYYTKAGPAHPLYLVIVSWVLIRAVLLLRAGSQDPNVSIAERRRRKLAFTACLFYLLAASEYLINYGVPLYPLGVIFMPVSFCICAYAIVRHQLLDIRIVIRRSMVYSLLVACITMTYMAAVLISERWFQGFFGYRSLPGTLLVGFLIALFFDPIRNRIQAFVDRALFRGTPTELAVQRDRLLAEVRRSEQMRAVGTLAAGLAHEIKNPLSAIKTFAEHMEERYADDAFRAKFCRIVSGEVERINLIVQQLLEFAKPMPPKLQPLQVPRLLDETLEFLNSELLQRHVTIHRTYAGSGEILGDPQQLKQVFLNLFLNSLQAMNGQGHLDIETTRQDDELIVTVADNGAGIDSKDLVRVFEPFYTTKSNGTGLGLAVVRSIVSEHGGRVNIESELHRGTTVFLKLPLST